MKDLNWKEQFLFLNPVLMHPLTLSRFVGLESENRKTEGDEQKKFKSLDEDEKGTKKPKQAPSVFSEGHRSGSSKASNS